LIKITLLHLVILCVYVAVIELMFKFISKKKSTLLLKFVKSILTVIGIIVIICLYLNHYKFIHGIAKTLLQSGTLIIAIATFSCQQMLGNIISGLLLSSTKPFDVGDKISLFNTAGQIVAEGIVYGMNARHVVLKKPDGKFDFINNSVVDSCVIENGTLLDDNGRLFTIECSYDSDVDLAIELLDRVIKECPYTIKKNTPAANILCSALNPNGYELKTTIWAENLDDSFKAGSYIRIHVAKLWQIYNIDIPYDTIHIK